MQRHKNSSVVARRPYTRIPHAAQHLEGQRQPAEAGWTHSAPRFCCWRRNPAGRWVVDLTQDQTHAHTHTQTHHLSPARLNWAFWRVRSIAQDQITCAAAKIAVVYTGDHWDGESSSVIEVVVGSVILSPVWVNELLSLLAL